MKTPVDLDSYPRRDTFRAFLHHQVPVLNVTCEVDITRLLAFRDRHGLRLFPLLAFVIDRTINPLVAFRHRIIDDSLYEYSHIHPSFTVLRADNTLSFCDARHEPEVRTFYRQVVERSAAALQTADLDMPDKHDRYFISNIPWLRFTAFSHPYNARYASIPIVTTGKFTRVGERLMLPVALQAHHSLVDGYHLGEFYQLLEHNLDQAEQLLKELQPI